MPLGDSGLLIRFDDHLNIAANEAAVACANLLRQTAFFGVRELVPSLVSVFVRYDPNLVGFDELASAIRLELGQDPATSKATASLHAVAVKFGGVFGPDLAKAARSCDMREAQFIAAHNREPLRVLATGFSPGFVYCGMHGQELTIPRRESVRSNVLAGSILFAAGQTAIMATAGPTGWHVIGRTAFNNFDVEREPPTLLSAGDHVEFGIAGD